MKSIRTYGVVCALFLGLCLPLSAESCWEGPWVVHDWTLRGPGGVYGLQELSGESVHRDGKWVPVSSSVLCLGCCTFSIPMKAWQVLASGGTVVATALAAAWLLSDFIAKRRVLAQAAMT